jgi:hypothetical protein
MSQIALIIIASSNFNEADVKTFVQQFQSQPPALYFICTDSKVQHEKFVGLAHTLQVYNTERPLKYAQLARGNWGFSKIWFFQQGVDSATRQRRPSIS